MRIVLALLMIAHGVAHLPGFLVPWRLMTVREMPHVTTILSGRVDLGEGGIRLVGLLWLGGAMVFAAAGVGALLRAPWWSGLALGAAIGSLLLALVSLPAARVGVWANLLILALLIAAGPLGWISLDR